MAKLMIQVIKFVLFITIFVTPPTWARARKTSQTHAQEWAKTVKSGKERTTTLQFYFHDTLSGKSPSAIKVAQPTQPNNVQSKTGFGVLMMADDPLTIGSSPKSKLVGRAQGLYGSACQDDLGLLMALSYTFNDGKYKGSISIMGRNSAMNPVREMPVVGGTGYFRMARGYALAHTYWFDPKTGDAIVGYNVTIVH